MSRLSLTREDITFLEKNTIYNEDQIREWFRYTILIPLSQLNQFINLAKHNFLNWMFLRLFKLDCPNCMMEKDKVEELYSMVMPQQNAEAFLDQMFKVDDKDGNCFLDFPVTLIYWNTDAFLSFSGVYAFVRFNGFCNS